MATGPATASGCGPVWVVLMELGQNGGIQNIITDHPGSFLWPVTLPVDEIFQVAGPSAGVQDVLYSVDGGFCLDYRRRRCCRFLGAWDRGREGFEEGNMECRMDSHLTAGECWESHGRPRMRSMVGPSSTRKERVSW